MLPIAQKWEMTKPRMLDMRVNAPESVVDDQ